MAIFFGWLIFSLIVGAIGSGRKIGFGTAFIFSLLLSPLIGLIITLVSKDNETEKLEQERQENIKLQTIALNEIKNKTTSSTPQVAVADELERLNNLKLSEAITSDEFQILKKRLIGSINTQNLPEERAVSRIVEEDAIQPNPAPPSNIDSGDLKKMLLYFAIGAIFFCVIILLAKCIG